MYDLADTGIPKKQNMCILIKGSAKCPIFTSPKRSPLDHQILYAAHFLNIAEGVYTPCICVRDSTTISLNVEQIVALFIREFSGLGRLALELLRGMVYYLYSRPTI